MRLSIPRRAGLVDLIPSTFQFFPQQRILIAAAGPLASIVSGLFLTALARRAPNGGVFWMLSFAALCSLAAAVELIPMRWGAAQSDGLIILDAIRGGRAFDQVFRNLLPVSSSCLPLRPRDWPADVVARLAEAADDLRTQRANLYIAYVHSQDSNHTVKAAGYLDRLLETWDPTDPPEYALEAAYVFGYQRRDAAEASMWLERATGPVDGYTKLRAASAVEWAKGDLQRAVLFAEQAVQACDREPDAGAIRYESDLLFEMTQPSSEPSLETPAENAA